MHKIIITYENTTEKSCEDSLMVKQGTPQFLDGGSNPTSSLQLKAKNLIISICDISEIRQFIETYHYSKNVNGVKISYCFKVEHRGFLVGAALFGAMSTTA